MTPRIDINHLPLSAFSFLVFRWTIRFIGDLRPEGLQWWGGGAWYDYLDCNIHSRGSWNNTMKIVGGGARPTLSRGISVSCESFCINNDGLVCGDFLVLRQAAGILWRWDGERNINRDVIGVSVWRHLAKCTIVCVVMMIMADVGNVTMSEYQNINTNSYHFTLHWFSPVTDLVQ